MLVVLRHLALSAKQSSCDPLTPRSLLGGRRSSLLYFRGSVYLPPPPVLFVSLRASHPSTNLASATAETRNDGVPTRHFFLAKVAAAREALKRHPSLLSPLTGEPRRRLLSIQSALSYFYHPRQTDKQIYGVLSREDRPTNVQDK